MTGHAPYLFHPQQLQLRSNPELLKEREAHLLQQPIVVLQSRNVFLVEGPKGNQKTKNKTELNKLVKLLANHHHHP